MMIKKYVLIFLTLPFLIFFLSLSAASEVKITANDGESNDRFGNAVSVSGNYAIIGAYKDDDKGDDAGAAYIFKYNGNHWIQEAKIMADDGMRYDYFGYSVSISGDDAIVGAFGAEFGTGAAYLFKRHGNTWEQEAKLIADDSSKNDYFGYSVSISNDYAIVGAYRENTNGKNAGAAYIFYRTETGWKQRKKLLSNDGDAEDRFGRYVSLFCQDTEKYAIISAIGDDDKGSNSGAAYIFKQNGTTWSQQTKLLANDGSAGDFFGFSVSIFGQESDWYAMVGADANEEKNGAAYIFKLNGTTWVQDAKLVANDGTGDFFGRSVSIGAYGTDWYAIAGADAARVEEKNPGAAYFFKKNGTTWIQEKKLIPEDSTADNFGWSVSVFVRETEWYALIGVEGDDSGSAYMYSGYLQGNFLPDIEVTPASIIIQKASEVRSQKSEYRSQESIIRQQTTDNRQQTTDNRQECSKGLVIPDDVIEYWEKHILPPRSIMPTNLPESIDWSVYDSPVKSQNSCGSCWAFAAVAMIENLVNQANLNINNDLSEQTIVSCPSGDCGGGWYWDAFNYIQDKGIPEESCYPYISKNGSCSDKCDDPDFLIKIEDFSASPGLWGEDQTVNDLKQALQSGPLCVAMRVPDDGTFSGNGYQGGVYDYNGDSIPWNGNSHAVLVVGYNDAEQSFKVKNSWGDWWGENGYFRISYDDVTDDVKFGSYACGVSKVYKDGETVSSSSFTIENIGSGDLEIYGITADKDWLLDLPTDFPLMLSSDESEEITISIINWDAIQFPEETGKITISSNDPDESELIVEVTARKKTVQEGTMLSVSPLFQEVAYAGGTTDIQIVDTNGEGIEWTATVNNEWLKILNESHNANQGKIIVQYEENLGVSRRGTITISATEAVNSPQIVEIIQAGKIPGPGDIDNNGVIDLKDAILALKVVAGIKISEFISIDSGDINRDNRIGLAEAIYALESVLRMR